MNLWEETIIMSFLWLSRMEGKIIRTYESFLFLSIATISILYLKRYFLVLKFGTTKKICHLWVSIEYYLCLVILVSQAGSVYTKLSWLDFSTLISSPHIHISSEECRTSLDKAKMRSSERQLNSGRIFGFSSHPRKSLSWSQFPAQLLPTLPSIFCHIIPVPKTLPKMSLHSFGCHEVTESHSILTRYLLPLQFGYLISE